MYFGIIQARRMWRRTQIFLIWAETLFRTPAREHNWLLRRLTRDSSQHASGGLGIRQSNCFSLLCRVVCSIALCIRRFWRKAKAFDFFSTLLLTLSQTSRKIGHNLIPGSLGDSSVIGRWTCLIKAFLSFKESGTKRCAVALITPPK